LKANKKINNLKKLLPMHIFSTEGEWLGHIVTTVILVTVVLMTGESLDNTLHQLTNV